MTGQSRLSAVREYLERNRLEAMLVTGRENCAYLSGFTGEGSLVVTATGLYILTDSRYFEQAGADAPAFELVKVNGLVPEALRDLLARVPVTRLGFGEEHVTYREYSEIADRAAARGCEMVPVRGVVESLREVKDAAEVDSIRKAASITAGALAKLVDSLKPGVSEIDLAAEVEYLMRKAGAERLAFEPVIVSGPRGSLPHGVPTARKIGRGEFVTFDIGAVWGSYCSDMTRTVAVGDPPEELMRVYEVVRKAQQAALSVIRPGLGLREADAAARSVIVDAGYGEYFGHGLGHGVGLAIHESPRLSPKAPENGMIREGMVFTVEPGVYIPGVGGVRIEDTVVARPHGVEVLTDFPKHLIRL
ncbi:MAG: aminopeptidase P family protein [Firmicutes bacterium]|nr:aminopeptidase P family protein [Bacillota bacterium]